MKDPPLSVTLQWITLFQWKCLILESTENSEDPFAIRTLRSMGRWTFPQQGVESTGQSVKANSEEGIWPSLDDWGHGVTLWGQRPGFCGPLRATAGGSGAWKERGVNLYLINVFFRFRITDWLVSSLKHNVLLRIGQRGKVRQEEERGKKKKSIWNSGYKSQWALKKQSQQNTPSRGKQITENEARALHAPAFAKEDSKGLRARQAAAKAWDPCVSFWRCGLFLQGHWISVMSARAALLSANDVS